MPSWVALEEGAGEENCRKELEEYPESTTMGALVSDARFQERRKDSWRPGHAYALVAAAKSFLYWSMVTRLGS